MTRVSITTYGEELVARELEAVGDRALNFRPMWRHIARKMERIVRETFETEGARSGDPWPPLSERYMWWKWNAGLSLLTLRATEEMYDALTSTTPDSIRLGTDTTFAFGADLDQFRIQQDWHPGNNFPERRPIRFTAEDVSDFSEALAGYMLGTVNAAGIPVNRRGQFAPGRRFL